MKRFQVSVAITVALILSCTASLIYISSCKQRFYSQLNDVYQFSYNDKEKCKTSLEKISKRWEKEGKALMLIIHHEDIDQIDFELDMLSEFLKADEMPEFRAELKKTTALINHLWEKEKPSLINII